ncbi:MAG: hypothetical protein BAA04_06915 [Firmicutes bacterium ZCTH02-B6]|nr:MAG: hypothetical protein BAA04_06915 [Firmicutes bacterium ZCTH02-B6]
MDSGRRYTEILDALSAMGEEILKARQEEDFLASLVGMLKRHVDCDAVILRWLERHIQTRALATDEGVQLVAPDTIGEPFTQEDYDRWLSVGDGIFCFDVRTAEYIKPTFREHALNLGLLCGFMAPLVREGEFLGQLFFAWRAPRELDDETRHFLRKLADYATLNITLFYVNKSRELDPLTGLLNRTGLLRRWEVCSHQPRGAVLFADLDGFKAMNDTRGHLAGDDFLRELARLLRRVADPGTVVARYGGDEFLLLVPGAGRDQAAQLRTRIVREIRRQVEHLPPPRPMLSMGIALWPEDGRDLSTLIQAADQRMYQYKRRRVALALTSKGTAQGRLPAGFFEGWLANSPDGIIITDPDLSVLYVNPAYERISGYSAREWIGKRPSLVSSGKTPRQVYREMWMDLHSVGAWRGYVINRKRSGGLWLASLAITKIVDRRGGLVGYVAISRDVTAEMSSGRPPFPEVLDWGLHREVLAFPLALAAEVHHGGSRMRLERVRHLTRILVEAAGRGPYPELHGTGWARAIVEASILLDVGKIAIPSDVLNKATPLTQEETALLRNHTVAGAELLRATAMGEEPPAWPNQFLETAIAIARSHHEHWDGSGYPDGLAGGAIPLEARLVAIADVYDALRSERPDKGPWPHAEAVEYIRTQAGRQFEPALVDVFLSVAGDVARVWDRLQDVAAASLQIF